MNIPIAHSTSPAECMIALKRGCEVAPRFVLFFSSSALDMAEAARLCHEAFPGSEAVGCSTAGEIYRGRMDEGSIVAIAIPPDHADQVAASFIANPGDPAEVAKAAAAIDFQLGQPIRELDPAAYVGIVVVDGLSRAEEKLMDKLGDLTDVPFVGGSAGDDLAFRKTWVSLNGRVWDHGAVIAVLHARKGYRILKTQSFRGTGRKLTATAVDENNRTILEFNGRPATEAYAAALGVRPDQLPELFMRHPLGLMIAGEPFVRSPQRLADKAIVLYCNVREGTDLEILESTNIVGETKAALATCISETGIPAALIDFNCILRTLELKAEGVRAEYGRLFAEIPAVGFSTYGEEYVGHMNQTSTMLLLAA